MKRQPRHRTTAPGAARRAAVLAGALALALAAVPGCGGDDDTVPAEPGGPAVASSKARRDERPDAVRLRRLIDEGRPDLAAPLVEALASELGVEGPLLRARLAVLQGDRADWLREIETARAMDPKDPRPYATAAELYAAIGRMQSSLDEITRGYEAAGSMTPELQRARGVYSIVTPGAGKIGLGLLEAALRSDPDLPFMARPLGQAYLLAAKRAMAEQQSQLALERIELSLEYDPEDRDARRTYAEIIIAANRDFDTGLAILEQLLADGEPVTELLARMAWSAGIQTQLRGDSEAARRYYLRARDLGAAEVARGTAATFLLREADKAYERALEAALAGNVEAVRPRIAEAVGLVGTGDSARYTFAERFVEQAQLAIVEGDLDRASRLVSAAVDTEPTVRSIPAARCSIYFNRAIEAMGEGDVESAVAFASEATSANPDDALAHQLLGELHYAREEYSAAVPALDRAVRNADLDGEPLGLDVVLMLAQCQHLSGAVDDAIATLEQSLRSSEGSESVDRARRDEAERYLRVLRDGEGG